MKRKTVGQLMAELATFPPTDVVLLYDTVGHPETPKLTRLAYDIKEEGLLGRTLFDKDSTVAIVYGNFGEDRVSDY